jgi:hypothetical protein
LEFGEAFADGGEGVAGVFFVVGVEDVLRGVGGDDFGCCRAGVDAEEDGGVGREGGESGAGEGEALLGGEPGGVVLVVVVT